jgi:hypothetical protein
VCWYFRWYKGSNLNILRESDIPAFALASLVACLLIIAKATLLFNNVYKYLLYGHKEEGRTERKHTWLESRARLSYGTQTGLSSFIRFFREFFCFASMILINVL